jgi:hypothetical protein
MTPLPANVNKSEEGVEQAQRGTAERGSDPPASNSASKEW